MVTGVRSRELDSIDVFGLVYVGAVEFTAPDPTRWSDHTLRLAAALLMKASHSPSGTTKTGPVLFLLSRTAVQPRPWATSTQF
jgi:hypothetical protein